MISEHSLTFEFLRDFYFSFTHLLNAFAILLQLSGPSCVPGLYIQLANFVLLIIWFVPAAKVNKAKGTPGNPLKKATPQPSRMAIDRTVQRAGPSVPSTSAPTPVSTRPSSPAPMSPTSSSFALDTGVAVLSLSQELSPPVVDEPVMTYSRVKLLEEARRSLTSTDGGKVNASMVVIGTF